LPRGHRARLLDVASGPRPLALHRAASRESTTTSTRPPVRSRRKGLASFLPQVREDSKTARDLSEPLDADVGDGDANQTGARVRTALGHEERARQCHNAYKLGHRTSHVLAALSGKRMLDHSIVSA